MTRSKPRVADRGNGCWRYKPYPEYRGSGIAWLGEIPAHWEVKRLRFTVTKCENGIWGDEPDGENDVACVRVADFDRTTHQVRIDSPTWRAVNPQIVSARLLGRDDLLLEKSGGGEKQPVGAVVRNTYPGPAVCSNFIARMPVAKSHHVGHLTYLHAALYSARINSRSIKQSIGIQNLDSKSYLNEFVALPKKSEQAAIAEFLDQETGRIDALVAKKERLIELLKEKRIALITQAVTRGLDPDAPMRDSGIEWLGEIPAHWEVRRLKHAATCNDEALRDSTDPMFAMDYVDIGSVDEFEGIIRRESTTFGNAPSRARRIVRDGDVVISTVRTYLRAIAAISNATPNLIVSTGFAVIRPRKMNSAFAQYAVRAPCFVEAVAANSVGVNYPAINADELVCLAIASPHLDEQQAIAGFLDRETGRIDALVDKVREAIERLKELRTALISAAVTGKIDVREMAA